MVKVPVIIIRHPRERRSKCTLEPLQGRPDLVFHNAKPGFTFDAGGHILLTLEGPPLSSADFGNPLLLLDSTWRRLPQLDACLRGKPIRRSLPAGIKSAYPRVSKTFIDPPGGLASVEALYVAKRILEGQEDATLLDHYHWREDFLKTLPPDF